MKGRIVSFAVQPRSRRGLVTFELDGDFGEIYDELKDVDIDLIVKKWKKRKSRDANANYWVLCGKLSHKIGISPIEVYREHIRNIGGNYRVSCLKEEDAEWMCNAWEHKGLGWVTDTMPSKIDGCINVLFYCGSSMYNSEQMSHLIDQVVQDCKEQNIETMSPAELASLKEAWK